MRGTSNNHLTMLHIWASASAFSHHPHSRCLHLAGQQWRRKWCARRATGKVLECRLNLTTSTCSISPSLSDRLACRTLAWLSEARAESSIVVKVWRRQREKRTIIWDCRQLALGGSISFPMPLAWPLYLRPTRPSEWLQQRQQQRRGSFAWAARLTEC